MIKMADFVEAKFKYLVTFKRFSWMSHLIVQLSVHENLIWVFFSNTRLEEVGEEDEDPCRTGAINTFVMGRPIWVTQWEVVITFEMLDEGLSDEHAYYPSTMLIPNDNAQTSHYMRGFYICLCHTFLTHRVEAYYGVLDWLLVHAPGLGKQQDQFASFDFPRLD